MPIPSPFHLRTSPLCTSLKWKDWAGYHAVCSYDSSHEPEYFACRQSAGLIDVSPLFKYEVRGADAARFLSYVTVKDVTKLKPGRVTYLCWCDDAGKVVDDGTVTNLGDGAFRITAAEPSFAWFQRHTRGFAIDFTDVSEKYGALSLQGPTSRDLLKAIVKGDIGALKFFGMTRGFIQDLAVEISRTGYTGDLGFELWVLADDATALYDALRAAGRSYGLMPVGLDAMDVTRIEAGFIMNGVDYFSAHHCMTEERKSSPFELGLGWTLDLTGAREFVGKEALVREASDGSAWQFVGLEIDWVELEDLFASYGLPPEISSKAWRDGRPIYDLAGNWIGMATSGAWSPTLKKNLAIGQVRTPFGREGQRLKIEVTVEYRRHAVTATVVKTPFFNPARKRS